MQDEIRANKQITAEGPVFLVVSTLPIARGLGVVETTLDLDLVVQDRSVDPTIRSYQIEEL